MEAQRPTPCPWLLDASGAIDHGRPRTPSRCGADPARGELSNQIRERRCLAGSACEIRDAREAALGPLAAALAPRQPVGDAELLSGSDTPQERPGRPWVRLMLIASLAALVVVGGGPFVEAVGPAIGSLIGSADSSAEPSIAPSESAPPTPSPTPTTTPTASPTATPTPSPTATAAPSSDTQTTYVVRKNDTLYGIACTLPIGCSGYKVIAELNGIPGPDYVIKRGQVLKLP